MKKKLVNFSEKFNKMQDAVIKEIQQHLERIGRDFSESDKDEIPFFDYSTPGDLGITGIMADGTFEYNEKTKGSMYEAIKYGDGGNFPFCDAISILESLRVIKTPKKK